MKTPETLTQPSDNDTAAFGADVYELAKWGMTPQEALERFASASVAEVTHGPTHEAFEAAARPLSAMVAEHSFQLGA